MVKGRDRTEAWGTQEVDGGHDNYMEEYTNRRIVKVLEEAVERLTLAKQLIDTQRETIKNQDEVIKDQREVINMLSEQVETLEGMLNG